MRKTYFIDFYKQKKWLVALLLSLIVNPLTLTLVKRGWMVESHVQAQEMIDPLIDVHEKNTDKNPFNQIDAEINLTIEVIRNLPALDFSQNELPIIEVMYNSFLEYVHAYDPDQHYMGLMREVMTMFGHTFIIEEMQPDRSDWDRALLDELQIRIAYYILLAEDVRYQEMADLGMTDNYRSQLEIISERIDQLENLKADNYKHWKLGQAVAIATGHALQIFEDHQETNPYEYNLRPYYAIQWGSADFWYRVDDLYQVISLGMSGDGQPIPQTFDWISSYGVNVENHFPYEDNHRELDGSDHSSMSEENPFVGNFDIQAFVDKLNSIELGYNTEYYFDYEEAYTFISEALYFIDSIYLKQYSEMVFNNLISPFYPDLGTFVQEDWFTVYMYDYYLHLNRLYADDESYIFEGERYPIPQDLYPGLETYVDINELAYGTMYFSHPHHYFRQVQIETEENRVTGLFINNQSSPSHYLIPTQLEQPKHILTLTEEGQMRLVEASIEYAFTGLHDLPYRAYLIRNEENTLSLLVPSTGDAQTSVPYWNEMRQENLAKTLPNSIYVYDDFLPFNQVMGYQVTSPYTGAVDWLEDNWHHLSPSREASIPPIAWQLLSLQSTQGQLLVEPIFFQDSRVSGYALPNSSITIIRGNYSFYTDAFDELLRVTVPTDQNGYFQANFQPHLRNSVFKIISDVDGSEVNLQRLNLFKPTALESENANFTLERYFDQQGYIEGHTYPNAPIVLNLHNHGFSGPTYFEGMADSKGYFYIEFYRYGPEEVYISPKLQIEVTDPTSGTQYCLYPLPWTQEALDHVRW